MRASADDIRRPSCGQGAHQGARINRLAIYQRAFLQMQIAMNPAVFCQHIDKQARPPRVAAACLPAILNA
jgi:hypothetical protein